MSRTILMLVPALAFALPFVASQPTMARPLATQAPETLWDDNDDHDDDDDDDDHDGDDDFIELHACFEAQIVLAEDDRAYSCDIVEGPACLSNCTAEAVAPLCQTEIANRAGGGDFASCQEERLAACRSQCDSGGAAFCSAGSNDLKVRHGDDDDDDDDDDDFENVNAHKDDDVIFIDVKVCIDLKIDPDDL